MDKLELITENEIDKIHEVMINTYGGLKGKIREGGSGSVLNSLHYQEGGIPEKTAYILSRMAKGHIYNDANKRTAYFLALYFAQLHDFNFKGMNVEEISEEMSKIASLPIDKSYDYALKLCKRDLILDKEINDYDAFYIRTLKPIELAKNLSKK